VAKKGEPKMSTHVGAVLHATPVARGCVSMPTVESQSVEGAPHRRAAPGSQAVEVAAEAATPGHRRTVQAWPPSLRHGRARPLQVEAKHPLVVVPRGGHVPQPCAQAQRLRTPPATAGVGASAHACHASGAHRPASRRPTLFASEHNGCSRGKCGACLRREPNPSIERTSQRPLRALWPAAHVER
jgi:hypothetical protein